MEDQTPTGQQGKWNKRLAILFAFLFALLWSLGAFFFWILFAFSFYFSFLAFWPTVTHWFAGMQSAFQNSQQPTNPYQSSRPRQPEQQQPVAVNVPAQALKVVRALIIGSIAVLFFFFLVGVFLGDDKTTDGQAVEITNEVPADDDGTSLWNDKGNSSLGNEQYDSAVYYYDKALAIDPENMFALYNKGLSYTLRQDFRRANTLTRLCVRFHPDYNPALWLLGYNYDLMNKTDSAVYFLEKAYVSDYSQPDFLQLMAEVYVKKDQRTRALEVYRKLVNMDTTRADIFRKMAELDPSNAEVYRNKANALEKK